MKVLGSARYATPCRLTGRQVMITTSRETLTVVEPVTGKVVAAEHRLVPYLVYARRSHPRASKFGGRDSMPYQPVTPAALTATRTSRRIDEIDHVPGEPKRMGRREHRT